MSRTMTEHVRYKSLFISLSFYPKQQREITKCCVVWRTRATTDIIKKINIDFNFILYLYLNLYSKRNKLTDLRVSQDSYIIQQKSVSSVPPSLSLNNCVFTDVTCKPQAVNTCQRCLKIVKETKLSRN